METMIPTQDGLSLWTESFGTPGDRPLLLIMGAMNQGIFWPDDFCRRLALSGYYVIRYDHRDTGKSSKVAFLSTPYDLTNMARDALAILRGLGLGKTTLVGLSMGGYIAQLMAIEHPEVVDRLVLIATSADHRPYMAATMGQSTAWFSLPGPEQALIDYIHASIADPPRTPEQFSENLIRGWQVTYDGLHPFPREQVARALNLAAHRCPDQSSSYQHALAVGASADRLDAVKRIVAPTLVIHGRYDVCLPLPHGEYLARNIANARLRVFDMGHSFMWSWDDEVLSAILDFCT